MSKTDPNVSYETSAKNQYLITLVVNILSFGWGIACGWSSPNIDLLQSDNTPLESGKITKDEGSWIVSLSCIGGLIGNFFFAFITNKFGRRKPLIAMAIPNILGWALIWYAKNVYYLYIGRLLNGWRNVCHRSLYDDLIASSKLFLENMKVAIKQQNEIINEFDIQLDPDEQTELRIGSKGWYNLLRRKLMLHNDIMATY